VSLLPPVLADYFTVSKLPLVLGLVFPIAGVGSILGSPMTGLMYDKFGSYDIAIYISALAMLIAAVILLFLPTPPSSQATKVDVIEQQMDEPRKRAVSISSVGDDVDLMES
jgi:MFS family permease